MEFIKTQFCNNSQFLTIKFALVKAYNICELQNVMRCCHVSVKMFTDALLTEYSCINQCGKSDDSNPVKATPTSSGQYLSKCNALYWRILPQWQKWYAANFWRSSSSIEVSG